MASGIFLFKGGASSGSGGSSQVETRGQALKVIVDEASATVTYVGEAQPGSATSGALWRVKRLTQSGVILFIEWADGDGLFNNVWDNRASLSYS